MATEIKMPQLSDTMDAGKILTWNKQEGDSISRGDILAEVETDKANLEIEAFHEGTLIKVIVPAGESVAVGEPIAFIGEAGEAVDSPAEAAPTPAATSDDDADVSTDSAASESQQPPVQTTASTTTAAATSAPQNGSTPSRVKISPLAKKLADQSNVDVSQIVGSGPNGRIIKKDVEAFTAKETGQTSTSPTMPSNTINSPAPQTPQKTQQSVAGAELGGTSQPLSKMRATIAKRMQQAVVEAPHFYTNISVDMTEAIKLRKVMKQDDRLKEVSINHLIMKSAAYSLQKVPGVNAAMKGDEVFQPNQINIGIVTAVDGGLMIPVIRSVDTLELPALAFETRAAVDRARAGRPTGSDLSGGTFSISNMGMFGVESFTAIISPGQGAILAVGATLEKAVVKDGQLQAAPIMEVTLSVDHRIIDGTMSGSWLSHFKAALEQPALLAL